MKKKLGVIITLLTLCICLMTPQMHAKAASGKTTIAVSAGPSGTRLRDKADRKSTRLNSSHRT